MEEKKMFSFEFSLEELDLVFKALQELPYKQVSPVVNKIIKGFEEQSKKVEAPEEKKK